MQSSTSARLNGLLAAVIDGDMSHLLYNLTPQNVNYADPRYRLPLLQWAISLGRLPTTELLLARGASLLALDGNGFTALHRAVWCADVAVVRALLFASPASRVPLSGPHAGRRGQMSNNVSGGSSSDGEAGVDAGGSGGGRRVGSANGQGRQDPPAVTAGEHTDHDFTLQLSKHAVPATAASEARTRSHTAVSWRPGAQQLVNMAHPTTGRTPLMLAAVRGAASIVSFLLHQCDADLYAEDNDGYTAAELAALCGFTDLLQLFLAKASGDGTGRAFLRIQQHAEDYVLTAKTVKQQQRLHEVNRRVCEDLAVQSRILPA